MGFEVVEHALYSRPKWCLVNGSETLRVGQLVKAGGDGVLNLGQASGAADTTNKAVPYGVVVATNLATSVLDTTYNSNYITQGDTHVGTGGKGDFRGVEGRWPKGDNAGMVQVMLIGPETVLKGRIFNGSYGTAITEGTVTTGSTTGAGFTCSGGLSDASTPVADLGTVYCRAGGNAGVYRITTDTSATVKTVGLNFPYDIAVGDTFVNVQMRKEGLSYVQTDAEAMFFDASANPSTNYWVINVIDLDLSTSGEEVVYFTFSGVHFDPARA